MLQLLWLTWNRLDIFAIPVSPDNPKNLDESTHLGSRVELDAAEILTRSS